MLQVATDGLRAADRDDGESLCVQVEAATLGERLERPLVARPLDEDDRTDVASHCERLERFHGAHLHNTRTERRERRLLSSMGFAAVG